MIGAFAGLVIGVIGILIAGWLIERPEKGRHAKPCLLACWLKKIGRLRFRIPDLQWDPGLLAFAVSSAWEGICLA